MKEDWWAIWLGLSIVVVAYVFFANGASIRWIAVTPSKWSTLPQLGAHFAGSYERYIVQFLAWLAVFTVALTSLGHKARDFLPSFAILYALSVAIFTLGQWDQALGLARLNAFRIEGRPQDRDSKRPRET